MTEPLVVEGDIVIFITKRVRTFWPLGLPLELPGLSGRLATEASVGWRFTEGAWRPSAVDVVSSIPRRDGTPSSLSKTHVLIAQERDAFLAAFPDAARPPAEHITINIEGAAE
ncbi:hypothetical protein [Microbacterium trichothecenolyticum]|uniref:Uncharacterized protein n=1 Tax=Microbacterium trichothecenolyticum TaxID=69370 RepID=A0A0M2HL13_MICTR|nr:hypothetical protein [Microbacterium trichothecenolyticum]KJL45590.1 hypothetical protein RS82_00142 [Microbacterium trichothecenolyticum]